jgi:hypothetical protein
VGYYFHPKSCNLSIFHFWFLFSSKNENLRPSFSKLI